MTQTIPFEPHRFQSAAPHYLAGRPPYASALFSRIAQLCDLRPTDRVMDLGCGPGPIARGLAPFVADVVALDPEPEMLRAAAAASAGFDNISWHRASSYDLSPALGRFRLVCMGRSFHWMDRRDTLRRLDGMIEVDGAVALLSDKHPAVPANAWYSTYREILERYASSDEIRGRWKSPAWVRNEGVLLESAFCRLEEITVMDSREISIETLIDRALSMSSTSRGILGPRADTMVAELRAALPDAGVVEIIASSAQIAWRA